jgi:hypothetical protein
MTGTMRILPHFIPFFFSRRFIGDVIHYSSTAWLELLVCAAIIAILAATGAGIYREQLQVANVACAIVGSPMADIKTDMMVFHAYTGQWPESFADLKKWPVIHYDTDQTDPAIQALTVEVNSGDTLLNY